MYYLVHTHYNGQTVHEHKYMTFDEAFVDYKSYTLSGLKEGTPYQCKKTMYVVNDGLFFEYVGKPYIPPVPAKWDGVDRRSFNQN
jgi:hypothetical protein